MWNLPGNLDDLGDRGFGFKGRVLGKNSVAL